MTRRRERLSVPEAKVRLRTVLSGTNLLPPVLRRGRSSLWIALLAGILLGRRPSAWMKIFKGLWRRLPQPLAARRWR